MPWQKKKPTKKTTTLECEMYQMDVKCILTHWAVDHIKMWSGTITLD